MIATDLPAPAKRAAKKGPAWPPVDNNGIVFAIHKSDDNEPKLRKKLHELGVDLVRMSPQHAMGATLQLHEPDILDHLRLSSG